MMHNRAVEETRPCAVCDASSGRADGHNRLRLVRVTYDVLARLLRSDGSVALRVEGLPEDAVIIAVSTDGLDCFGRSSISIKVWSSEFSPVEEGSFLPEVSLEISAVEWREQLMKLARQSAPFDKAGEGCTWNNILNASPPIAL